MTMYADTADVQALTPARRFGPQTQPSTADVIRYLDMRSRELDAVMSGMQYSVPIPDTAVISRGWLRMAVAYGAAADAEAAGPNTSAEQEGVHLQYLRRRWDAMLKMLGSGGVILSDAPRDTSPSASRVSLAASTGTAMFAVGDLYGGRIDGLPGRA